MCGTESKNLELEAALNPKTFSYTKMQRVTRTSNELSNKRYDACYYQIKMPHALLKTGELKMKFKELKNVVVYWSGGEGLSKTTKLFNDGTSIDVNSNKYIN